MKSAQGTDVFNDTTLGTDVCNNTTFITQLSASVTFVSVSIVQDTSKPEHVPVTCERLHSEDIPYSIAPAPAPVARLAS